MILTRSFSSLEKYVLIFKLHWQNWLSYPLSFVMWRLRQLFSTLASLTLWTAIFQQQQQVFGYSQESMASYIFLTAVLQSLILATFLNGLTEDIYTGHISNMFVKPLKPMGVWITQEIADKSMNFVFVLFEVTLLTWLFRPQLFWPSWPNLLLCVAAAFLGAVLLFFIMLLFGVIGFWSRESWGPRFLFYMFLEFTAGKLYPLDVLPDVIEQLLYFTPFPYLSYVQTQIFLGKYSLEHSAWAIFCITLWIVILRQAFRFFWQKGLKEYGAMGR